MTLTNFPHLDGGIKPPACQNWNDGADFAPKPETYQMRGSLTDKPFSTFRRPSKAGKSTPHFTAIVTMPSAGVVGGPWVRLGLRLYFRGGPINRPDRRKFEYS